MIKYVNGNLLIDDKFVKRDFAVYENKFTFEFSKDEIDETVDLMGKKVVPSFIDRHTHGCNGVDFNSLSSFEDMKKALEFYVKSGVTSVFPTIAADDAEQTLKVLKFISSLMPYFPEIEGVHLEGPYLSEDFKGRIPKEYLQPVDIETFRELQAAGGYEISILTLSPELPNADKLISYATEKGVVVSMGHSNATFDEAEKGAKAGAKCLTHFLNSSRPFKADEAGITGYGLFDHSLVLAVIADLKHVDVNSLKVLFNVVSPKRICLISDSTFTTGLADGNYELSDDRVFSVEDGVATLNDGTVIGTSFTAMEGVRNLISKVNVDEITAIKTMTEVPAKLQNLKKGQIKEGYYANFLTYYDIFDKFDVYFSGELVK